MLGSFMLYQITSCNPTPPDLWKWPYSETRHLSTKPGQDESILDQSGPKLLTVIEEENWTWTHTGEKDKEWKDAGQSQESLESYGCINKALGLESFSVVSDEAQPCRHPCVGIFWLSQLQVVCGTTHWKQGGDRQASGCGVYRRDIPVVGSWEKCFELMIPRRGLRFLTQIITAIPGKRNTVDQKWVVDRLLGMEGEQTFREFCCLWCWAWGNTFTLWERNQIQVRRKAHLSQSM